MVFNDVDDVKLYHKLIERYYKQVQYGIISKEEYYQKLYNLLDDTIEY